MSIVCGNLWDYIVSVFFWFVAFSDLSTDCRNLKKIAKILFDFFPVYGNFSIIFSCFFGILDNVGILTFLVIFIF